MGMYWTPNDEKRDVAKVIACLVLIALFSAIMLSGSGCSWSAAGGLRAETYYPKSWQKGGDPANSRASGVDVASSSTPGRPPVPGGN